MTDGATLIRRSCHLLISIQAIGIGWCVYGIGKALLDEPSDCGLTGSGLIPFFAMAIVMIGSLLLITLAVMRRSTRRYAWVALLFVTFITILPFAMELMN